jgi:hypothetical protein
MTEPQPVPTDELVRIRAALARALADDSVSFVPVPLDTMLAVVRRLQHLELRQELVDELHRGVAQASAKLETLISTLRETNAQGEAWLRRSVK